MKPSLYSPSSSSSTEMAGGAADVKPVEATNRQRSAASGTDAELLSMISSLGIHPGLGATDGLDVSATRTVVPLEHYNQSTAQKFALAATPATRIPLLAFPNYAAASAGSNQQLLRQPQQQQLQINRHRRRLYCCLHLRLSGGPTNSTHTPATFGPPPPRQGHRLPQRRTRTCCPLSDRLSLQCSSATEATHCFLKCRYSRTRCIRPLSSSRRHLQAPLE